MELCYISANMNIMYWYSSIDSSTCLLRLPSNTRKKRLYPDRVSQFIMLVTIVTLLFYASVIMHQHGLYLLSWTQLLAITITDYLDLCERRVYVSMLVVIQRKPCIWTHELSYSTWTFTNFQWTCYELYFPSWTSPIELIYYFIGYLLYT